MHIKYLSILGLLAFGTLAAEQAVRNNSQLLYTEDGAQIEKRADGSKIVKTPDGTIIEVKADGSKTVKKTDGTVIQVPAKP